MTAEITIVPSNHPFIIRFPEQSDYENNKTKIKRIIKTKFKLNKFVYATGEWFNENDTEKSIVVKRFTNEKGYTNALLFKGSQKLVEDVKTLLDSLKIKYEEKEVSEKEVPEHELPKSEAQPSPVVSKSPTFEITPEEFLKIQKETEDRAFKDYDTRRIMAFNAEIDKKMISGLLDEDQAYRMKEEFSRKMEIFFHMWSEAGDKWLKEKLTELHSPKADAEPDEGFKVSEKPKEIEVIKGKKKARKKMKR
ncbi:MAG: hypothetical protein J5U17_02685 [Candidatus Methanoperedens sp.]|nr:hypothetical protein [Candidatus Methanoperedens sp.]